MALLPRASVTGVGKQDLRTALVISIFKLNIHFVSSGAKLRSKWSKLRALAKLNCFLNFSILNVFKIFSNTVFSYFLFVSLKQKLVILFS